MTTLIFVCLCFSSIKIAVTVARTLQWRPSSAEITGGAVALLIAVPTLGAAISAVVQANGLRYTALSSSIQAAAAEEVVRLAVAAFILRRAKQAAGCWFGVAYGSVENLLIAVNTIFFAFGSEAPDLSSVALGGFERIVSLLLQMVYSVLCFLSIKKRQALWFVMAISVHFLVDYISLSIASTGHNSKSILFLFDFMLVVATAIILYRASPVHE